MMQKEIYQEAEMEVVEFFVQDVISTSFGNGSGGGIVLPDDEW